MRPRIRIIDDHELLAESLVYALLARGIDAGAVRPSSREAVVAALVADRPDVVMLDLQLGGDIGSGATLVRPLVEAGIRVLVVSGVTDRIEIATSIEAGAAGFVSKGEQFDVLLDTVATVAEGTAVMSPDERLAVLDELRRHRAQRRAVLAPFQELSPRERQVLRALCAGESVAGIAASAYVSVPTVRSQVRAILLKLDVASQLEAVALAHRCGWYAEGEPVSA